MIARQAFLAVLLKAGELFGMEPPLEVTSWLPSFKVPPQVLVVADDPASSGPVAEAIAKKFNISTVKACSVADAAAAIRGQSFDMLFFSHPNWEKGVQLYVEILSTQTNYCQLILFLDDPSVVRPSFLSHVKAVDREDISAILRAANWSGWDPGAEIIPSS